MYLSELHDDGSPMLIPGQTSLMLSFVNLCKDMHNYNIDVYKYNIDVHSPHIMNAGHLCTTQNLTIHSDQLQWDRSLNTVCSITDK